MIGIPWYTLVYQFKKMEYTEESYGEKSLYNEAQLKMLRIHESQKLVNFLRTNMTYYEPTMNKYNYEIMVFELISLYSEIEGKLSDPEKKTGLQWRDTIIKLLETLPLKSRTWKIINGKKQLWETTKKDNWDILRKAIFSYEDFIKVMMEEHGLSTYNEEKIPDWEA